MKAIAGMAAGVAILALGGFIARNFPNPYTNLTVTNLRGGAYWIEGGVSNTGFIVGDKGVIVIDAQMFSPTARNAQAEIARITSKPINTMIITHSDPDHVNGLPTYPEGIEIIAQENAKREMQEALDNPNRNPVSSPPETLRHYMPTHLIRDRESLMINGVQLVLIHTGPAHTDGDLIVFLPDLKLVYAADILSPEIGLYPGIHLEKHGSSLGWIEFAKAMLALDADTFVSGHGAPMTRAELKARIDVTVQRRDEIKALVGQHKSLKEIKDILNDERLPGVAGRFPTFVETTYQELTRI